MLHSMTGFARQAVETPLGTLTCELRAVNHRYLDVQFKIPEQLRPKELQLRQRFRCRREVGVDVLHVVVIVEAFHESQDFLGGFHVHVDFGLGDLGEFSNFRWHAPLLKSSADVVVAFRRRQDFKHVPRASRGILRARQASTIS